MDTKHPAGAGSPHLSDEELAQFGSGEISAAEARHIESCAECGGRLRDMQASYDAYRLYWDTLQAPLLPPPPKPWQPLDRLIQGQSSPPVRGFRWWPVPAIAAGAVLAVVIAGLVLYNPGQTASARANRLLTASAKLPSSRHGLISVRVHGRTLVRPAVMASETAPADDADIVRLQVAFARASYDWREPLSARAFQLWRSRLPKKRDSVSVIRTADATESYRVRTETDFGGLRTASLTLRAPDLHPVAGDFDFQNEGSVEMAEAPPGGGNVPGLSIQPPRTSPVPSRTETFAGPEVTLHVLAALNRIGADVGEPVEIAQDSRRQRVVVHAAGISRERRQQIADVLKPLPHVMLEFDAGQSAVPPARAVPQERYSASIPAPLRRQFEDRLGGAARFQEATDRMLEAGASAVAQAHALETLALDFSSPVEAVLADPDRELLHRLRDNHISELQNLVSRIENDLEPLLPALPKSPPAADGASAVSWQASAAPIVDLARKTDDALNRLLAGSYAQSSGDDMLRAMAAQIAQLDAAIRVERQAGR
jgi:hypothetical protein